MECITACPDTALPNTSQDVATVLKTAVHYYVTDPAERTKLAGELKGIEERARAKMNESVKAKTNVPFKDIIRDEVNALTTVADQAKAEFTGIIDKLPLSYSQRARHLPFAREPRRPAPAVCSPSSSPTCARAAANACRSAAITTRCA